MLRLRFRATLSAAPAGAGRITPLSDHNRPLMAAKGSLLSHANLCYGAAAQGGPCKLGCWPGQAILLDSDANRQNWSLPLLSQFNWCLAAAYLVVLSAKNGLTSTCCKLGCVGMQQCSLRCLPDQLFIWSTLQYSSCECMQSRWLAAPICLDAGATHHLYSAAGPEQTLACNSLKKHLQNSLTLMTTCREIKGRDLPGVILRLPACPGTLAAFSLSVKFWCIAEPKGFSDSGRAAAGLSPAASETALAAAAAV